MGWLKNWIAKRVGKKLAKNVGLTEGTMEGKSKWKSKTVWAAILTGVLSMVGPVSEALGHPVVIPEWVYNVLIGMGLYGLRDAKTPLKGTPRRL